MSSNTQVINPNIYKRFISKANETFKNIILINFIKNTYQTINYLMNYQYQCFNNLMQILLEINSINYYSNIEIKLLILKLAL